jgi:hypothetical protein
MHCKISKFQSYVKEEVSALTLFHHMYVFCLMMVVSRYRNMSHYSNKN